MASSLARLRTSPVAPMVGGIAGIVAGGAAVANAPDGFGAVAWALSLCALALLGRVVIGRFGRPRAAAAFIGILLAHVPFVCALAYGTLQQQVTYALTPLSGVLGVPLAVLTLGAVTIAGGACFAEERPRLERALVHAAATACAMCLALGVWTRSSGTEIPSSRSYLGSLPVFGSVDRLPAEFVAYDATISTERRHHVAHIGADPNGRVPGRQTALTVHRSCLPPEGPTYVLSRPCMVAVGEGVEPQDPSMRRWVGPVSSFDLLEVRVDPDRGLWVVTANERSYAFRGDDSTPTVLTLGDTMAGPPLPWAFVAAPGALIAIVSLWLRRRRARLLEDLSGGVDGTVIDQSSIALDDGRTVNAAHDLPDDSRVVVIVAAAGSGAYRKADLPTRVLPGDRSARAAELRAAQTADALLALVAASAPLAVLVAPLL